MFTVRELAATVRELRDERGWSQAELAARANLSRSFVIDVESGKQTVEAGKLFDLLQALGWELALRSRMSGDVRW